MAEINDIFQDQFPDLLIQQLREASEKKGIKLDEETERKIAKLALDYLQSRERFIQGKFRQETSGEVTPERYYQDVAEDVADELSQSIVENVESNNRTEIHPNDFRAAIGPVCPLPPIC